MEHGEEHNETVWSWGAGSEGQLSTGTLDDEFFPQLLRRFPASPVSQIACGGAHVVALCGGKVLSWGRGSSGQLGHGDQENSLQPKPIKFFEDSVISYVSAGWNHSGFVSDEGRVFTCGDGSFGQLGHGNYVSHSSPMEISFFTLKDVKQIACGMRHSIVLEKGMSGALVHGFGFRRRGQLGVFTDKTNRSCNLPQVIVGFEGCEIISVHANGDHSAALCANGCLYNWGRGFDGAPDVYSPQRISTPIKFLQVALGWNHALLLTAVDGRVLMFGGANHGMLSNPWPESRMDQAGNNCASQSDICRSAGLVEVRGLDGKRIIFISAGAEHSALVTEDGHIMTWGWGEHGQLGLGNNHDEATPRTVGIGDALTDPYSRLRVYCGSGFTYVVASR